MEIEIIIDCPSCGFLPYHVTVSDDVRHREEVCDFARSVLSRSHAATHKVREFHCVMGHTLSPPDTDTDNRGNGYAGCRQHGDWTLSRSSQSDG